MFRTAIAISLLPLTFAQSESNASFRISGQVIDPSGATIPSVSVSLKLSIGNEIVATTKTNANGEFELSGPTKKSYELWIESPGWITYQKTIDGSTGGVARLPAITVNPASGGVFEYPVPPGFVFAPRKDPIWTTVCELINNPAEYSGHIVRVHGAITKQFDVSTLSEAYS